VRTIPGSLRNYLRLLRSGVPIVHAPGYLQKETIAQVETNFYSTAKPDGELVWTGTTNAFDANSPMKVIKVLAKIVIKELEKQDVIDPRA
jgi:hypothetical protein